jgi:hypothetical protein
MKIDREEPKNTEKILSRLTLKQTLMIKKGFKS